MNLANTIVLGRKILGCVALNLSGCETVDNLGIFERKLGIFKSLIVAIQTS